MFRRKRVVSLVTTPLVAATGWLVVASVGIAGTTAYAQQADPPAAITQLQADAIANELKEIRKMLEAIQKRDLARAPQVPQTAKVSVQNSPALGAADAALTIVEFTDYQCPYCLRFHQTAFPRLKEKYVDSGQLKWVVLDLPLSFHPNARKAAQAALCAGDQDKFWEMRGVLFTNAKKLEEQKLPKYAQLLGLDMTVFNACLDSDKHLAKIDRDLKDASKARVTGTPHLRARQEQRRLGTRQAAGRRQTLRGLRSGDTAVAE